MHTPYLTQSLGMHPHILSLKLTLLSIKSNFYSSEIDSSTQNNSQNSDLSRVPLPLTKTGTPQETMSSPLF